MRSCSLPRVLPWTTPRPGATSSWPHHLAINRGELLGFPVQKIRIISRWWWSTQRETQSRIARANERTEIVAKIVLRPDNLGLSTWYTQGGIADANTSQLRSVSKWVNLRQSVSSIPAETSGQLKWNKDQPLFSERIDRISLSFSMYMSSRVFFSPPFYLISPCAK